VRIAVVDMNLGDAVTNKSVVAFKIERKIHCETKSGNLGAPI
jgi:hypothetical protein